MPGMIPAMLWQRRDGYTGARGNRWLRRGTCMDGRVDIWTDY
jgi:hypothetical protein